MPLLSDKRASWLFLTAASIAVVAFSAALILLALLLHPTPPRSVTMATDPENSFNANLAKRYREYFAKNGIDLKWSRSQARSKVWLGCKTRNYTLALPLFRAVSRPSRTRRI